MNIFLVMLISVFMAAYYMFFAPNARIQEHETDYAIAVSDLRSIAECALAVHNAKLSGYEFNDVCVTQHQIQSEFVCLDSKYAITDCDADGFKQPMFSYVITKTGTINTSDYNDMMEILEKYFSNNGAFGIFQDGVIVAGGTSAKRSVPESIVKQMNIENGQIMYMTHYDKPDADKNFTLPDDVDIVCPAGTTKTYRFGRWQCVGYNLKTTCGGDMIWDSDVMECVPDESRKPLCAGQQTAVIVDEVWECVNPFNERKCPGSLIARLNYDTLEWECVEDPNKTQASKKCSASGLRTIRGRGGATVRVATTLCTDCEKTVIDEDTCVAVCVPDVSKITSPACYPGRVQDCSGLSRAFYFGFPSAAYVANVGGINSSAVPFDSSHSQNRKFNCLDCGSGRIDTSLSNPPYIAVCRE